MTRFKEWCCHLAFIATNAALTERIVTHAVHFATAVEEKHMVDTAGHLLDVLEVGDLDGRLVNLQFTSDLLSGTAKKADVAR